MRLKITSDGTAAGTRVLNADTGEVVERVCRVSWTLDADGVAGVATVEVRNVPVELVAERAYVVEERHL